MEDVQGKREKELGRHYWPLPALADPTTLPAWLALFDAVLELAPRLEW